MIKIRFMCITTIKNSNHGLALKLKGGPAKLTWLWGFNYQKLSIPKHL